MRLRRWLDGRHREARPYESSCHWQVGQGYSRSTHQSGVTAVFTGPNSTISASLYKKLPYNFLQDLVAVGSMMRFPNVMVVPSSLPTKSVQEFIDHAKANPGRLSLRPPELEHRRTYPANCSSS